jgi:uncharacterized protein
LQTVVSDSGPLIHLAQINKLAVLQRLFGCIIVTPRVRIEVVDEGIQRNFPDAQVAAEAFSDGWITVETLSAHTLEQAANLASGEGISPADAQVILLAEKKEAMFLSDDNALLKIAEMYGLKVLDTWSILLEAQSHHLVTLTEIVEAVEELGKKKFRLNPKQTQEILDAAKSIDKRRNKKRIVSKQPKPTPHN